MEGSVCAKLPELSTGETAISTNMDTPSTPIPAPTYNAQNYLGSPDPQNNHMTKQPMSATLRERLRKTRRSFNSAFIVAKRLKIDCEDNESSAGCATENSPALPVDCDGAQLNSPGTARDTCRSEIGTSLRLTPAATFKYEMSPGHMFQEKRRMMKKVEEKEEILRRLKMVKLYRSKNNLPELQSLIEKWRKSSQCLLYELQAGLSAENRKVSLTQLIENFGLDEKLLNYNKADEDFEDT